MKSPSLRTPQLLNTLKAGILGGGQLSMMLSQKAQALGLYPEILTPSAKDPAAFVSPRTHLGDPKNEKDLKTFSQNLELLTFESEFYNAEYLEKVLPQKIQIFPSLQNLQTLQDRQSQKQSFAKAQLLTSPFICTPEEKQIQKFFKEQKSLVAKKRWNGYDGYGTFILKTSSHLDAFLQKNKNQLSDFIFEKLIPFEYEIAVQAGRSRSGHTVFFPFVKTIQKDNKCFLVEGPEKPQPALQKKLQNYLDKMNYVGVMGFEFFKTSKGLILNEVAPRVHNTGHHTLDSCTVDQFTLHWLCALQDKLPNPEPKCKAFVMLNLIGQHEQEDSPAKIPARANSSGQLFWYGKTNRPGRKLGHINFTGENKKALVKKALTELKRWSL